MSGIQRSFEKRLGYHKRKLAFSKINPREGASHRIFRDGRATDVDFGHEGLPEAVEKVLHVTKGFRIRRA